ncbi:hypothetical protein EVAR_80775_1 [Eumeta japonica]|uniref:Uncharacterized protein n=1 Tax=Eumeta variegata TaxID=151549 RepID=A0A4C1X6N1_EUMVA|nr:hypothetical protein EVAR_80775_1 [Eumeta japonica]
MFCVFITSFCPRLRLRGHRINSSTVLNYYAVNHDPQPGRTLDTAPGSKLDFDLDSVYDFGPSPTLNLGRRADDAASCHMRPIISEGSLLPCGGYTSIALPF